MMASGFFVAAQHSSGQPVVLHRASRTEDFFKKLRTAKDAK
jgi:hypothetical protein